MKYIKLYLLFLIIELLSSSCFPEQIYSSSILRTSLEVFSENQLLTDADSTSYKDLSISVSIFDTLKKVSYNQPVLFLNQYSYATSIQEFVYRIPPIKSINITSNIPMYGTDINLNSYFSSSNVVDSCIERFNQTLMGLPSNTNSDKQSYKFKLKQAPLNPNNYKFYINITTENGQVFQDSTPSIYIY